MHRLRSIPWHKITYVLKGILVGAVAGIVVSAFRMAIDVILTAMPNLYEYLRENPLWIIGWIIFILLAASLVIVLMRDEPNIQGNGVAELKGQLQGTLKLNWFSVLWRKFVSSTLVLGLGLPLGQEGPSIQIGGVVGQGLNTLLKGDKSQENIFISSGAAAGLAAAFNAPLSAFVLVLEEIHHRFSNVLILSVFSASITASFFAFNIFGSDPAIGLGPTATYPIEKYFYLVGLGIVVGVGGWLFQRGIFKWGPKFFKSLPIPRYLHGFIPFILVIVVGLFWTEMLGGGTGVIMEVASARFATRALLGVLVFRFLAFQLGYGSGLPGGSLVPSLAFGALLGAIYGNVALDMTGLDNPYLRNFVIYGMGGFFTATTKAPLTGIVLITELTGSMNQLMPISIVSLTAYVISDLLRMEPTDEITLQRKVSRYPTMFEGKLAQFNIVVAFNGRLDGMLIKELKLPYNAKVVKITRDTIEILPHNMFELKPGDDLEIACDSGFIQPVQQYFDQANEEE